MENYSGSCSNGSLGSGSPTDHFKRKFIKCSAWDSAGKLWKTSHWSVRMVDIFIRYMIQYSMNTLLNSLTTKPPEKSEEKKLMNDGSF